MAWTAPITAVAGAVFTASQFNASIRDDLLETAPAKATSAQGAYFVATGANSIAQRLLASDVVNANESTASTEFVSLTTVGPTVTVTTGDRVLVTMECQIANTGTGQSLCGLEISGATTHNISSPNSANGYLYGISTDGNTANLSSRFGMTYIIPVNAGSNTFTLKYRASSGTASFRRRTLCVMAF